MKFKILIVCGVVSAVLGGNVGSVSAGIGGSTLRGSDKLSDKPYEYYKEEEVIRDDVEYISAKELGELEKLDNRKRNNQWLSSEEWKEYHELIEKRRKMFSQANSMNDAWGDACGAW